MSWTNHIPLITPQPTVQPPQPMMQPPQESIKGLEITGLALSSVPILALAGVVLSIIALAKTKSLRGTPSTLSIIGVVIGIFMSILTIASIVPLGNESSWNDIIDMAKKEAYSMHKRKRSNRDSNMVAQSISKTSRRLQAITPSPRHAPPSLYQLPIS
ncbi:MAG: hypothetical protein Q4A34_01015 [Candidatus Saccharibacteria bacterium]|nr:hypothetical protein [Candidatus Saccharibacteria bacterium]